MTFEPEEMRKIVEDFFKGLPLSDLFDDLPEGLLDNLSEYRKEFKGSIPEKLWSEAFLFFAIEKDWRGKRFKEKKKELQEKAAHCRRAARDMCLYPIWMKRRIAECFFCSFYDLDPETNPNLISTEHIEACYDFLSSP